MPAPLAFRDHLRLTGTALRHWFVAQCQDSLAVGLLWLIGLWIIGVPWPLLWATLAAVLQFVPQLGAMLGLLGPLAAAVFFAPGERWWGWLPANAAWVLILYAAIAALDGLWLQPWLMKRTVQVPVWASILAPIALGIAIPFWGALLAPPLLAVVYAYRRRRQASDRKLAGASGPNYNQWIRPKD